ncbi:pentapeptide repeat-containing protein [Chloroflexota bacterium]
MGDGTKESPYTREDLETAIKEHGGTANGLDLSKKVFEVGIDLSGKYDEEGINLSGANLFEAVLKGAVFDKCHLEGVRLIGANLEGAWLEEAHLEGSNLSGAHMGNTHFVSAHLEKSTLNGAHFEGAEFFNAHLEEADLINTFLDKTRLSGAHLQSVKMLGAKFTANTKMNSIDWGDYILGEEKEGEKEGKIHSLKWAEDIYRELKVWYTNAGYHDTAAKFYYREKEARRKSIQNIMHMLLKQRERRKLLKLLRRQEGGWTLLWLWIYRLLCGYAEKTLRIIGWAAFVIFGSALIYFLIGSTREWGAFWSSLYFSAVSFTALGYGSWINEIWIDISNDWIREIGAAESFAGVFLMALFLITFVRKMTR